MIGTFFIREEVEYNGIWEGADDVKDTSKIGVNKVHVVRKGLVVFGFSVVDLGTALGLRRLI